MTPRPWQLSLAVLTQEGRKIGKRAVKASDSYLSVHRTANESPMVGVSQMAVPMPKMQKGLAGVDATGQADPS